MTPTPGTFSALSGPIAAVPTIAAAVAIGTVAGARPGAGAVLVLGVAAAGGLLLFGLRKASAGIALAVLAGAVLDGLPGPVLTGNKALLAMVLLASAGLWVGRHRMAAVPIEIRALAVYLTVCAGLGIGRSWSAGYPIGASAKFGLDFLLFGALVVGLTASFADRDVRHAAVRVIGLLAVWVSVVNIAASLGYLEPTGFFAHAYNSTAVGSVTRIYSYSRELPTVAIPFGFAAALMARTAMTRTVAIGVTLVCSSEVLLELGRAKYAGLAIAIILIAVLWGPRFRTRLVVALLLVISVLAAASRAPAFQEPLNQLQERALSIVSNEADSDNADGDTLAYRDVHKAAIRESMNTAAWVAGRGFRPSTSYAFAPDPTRSLRNSDLGWYNALNTMGILGTIGLYGLLFATLRTLWKARRISPTEQWLVAGATGYLVYVLVVSPTLVSLFSSWGLTTVALAIGLGLSAAQNAVASGGRSR